MEQQRSPQIPTNKLFHKSNIMGYSIYATDTVYRKNPDRIEVSYDFYANDEKGSGTAIKNLPPGCPILGNIRESFDQPFINLHEVALMRLPVPNYTEIEDSFFISFGGYCDYCLKKRQDTFRECTHNSPLNYYLDGMLRQLGYYHNITEGIPGGNIFREQLGTYIKNITDFKNSIRTELTPEEKDLKEITDFMTNFLHTKYTRNE